MSFAPHLRIDRGDPQVARPKFDRVSRRKLFSGAIMVLSGLTIIVVLIPLVSVIYEAVIRGGSVLLNPRFFTALPPNGCSSISCSTVGIGPDIEGTFILMVLAGTLSTLIGVFAAVFASEYSTRGLGRAISFTADVMTGIPSIIAGVVVYSYFALYYPSLAFSTETGVLALSIIMIPVIVRTTEESLRTVPNTIREAALALGIPKWRTTTRIVLGTALPGVLTGVLLALMRAAGDAAPLLFTAFGSRLYFQGLNHPIAALPLIIFNDAESAYPNQISVAWGAVLLLLVLVLAANVLSRISIQRMVRRMEGR
ncbi:MAG: phosphate ABC transporter permease PstA [Thermoplasmata archaeon]